MRWQSWWWWNWWWWSLSGEKSVRGCRMRAKAERTSSELQWIMQLHHLFHTLQSSSSSPSSSSSSLGSPCSRPLNNSDPCNTCSIHFTITSSACRWITDCDFNSESFSAYCLSFNNLCHIVIIIIASYFPSFASKSLHRLTSASHVSRSNLRIRGGPTDKAFLGAGLSFQLLSCILHLLRMQDSINTFEEVADRTCKQLSASMSLHSWTANMLAGMESMP